MAEKIPGLPQGWEVREFYRTQNEPRREAWVICERTQDDGDHGLQFVVWNVNMIEGGCYNGFYTDSYDAARTAFVRRKR